LVELDIYDKNASALYYPEKIVPLFKAIYPKINLPKEQILEMEQIKTDN